MFKDKLLLGQYYQVDSPIHSLHPGCKLLVTLIYMAAVFIPDDWLGWCLLTAVCTGAIFLSQVPFGSLWRGMKLIVILCCFTLLVNIFSYQGQEVWHWYFLRFSWQGLLYGLAMSLRLLLLVAFASLLTLTTRPVELSDGLELLFQPLTRWHFPAQEIAMMTTIALRFIPTLAQEFQRIVLAQRARGVNFRQGSLITRCRAFVPLLVPLFVSAFRRADELAQAMEAKCYRGGQGRSHWRELLWRWQDTAVLSGFGCLLLLLIAERIFL